MNIATIGKSSNREGDILAYKKKNKLCLISILYIKNINTGLVNILWLDQPPQEARHRPQLTFLIRHRRKLATPSTNASERKEICRHDARLRPSSTWGVFSAYKDHPRDTSSVF